MLDLVKQGVREAGGITKLAKGLRVRHQSLYSWKQVPAGRVLMFETLTGISRHVQRPDIYPLPVSAKSTPAAGDTADRAGAACPDPIPETSESPTPSRGVADPVVTPAPADG
jgi:DNA-binding transcriptional regulator YdaS (Cro superfamily)